MSDPERCKFFLEQILDIQIDHVEYLEKKKTIDMKIDARSVRLDIYMSDGKAIYNVEMQTTSGKNLPKRSRYYQGQIDMNLITKGENFNKLKKSFVFICTFDPFGQNRRTPIIPSTVIQHKKVMSQQWYNTVTATSLF